jgi:(E)-4-hydroxy-3-methylbut-2-enyl-diphosphate synthase
VVNVGDVAIGGSHPIRIQSMTTTDTRGTQATADQTERLADAGCEIVRITAPSIRDAENLAQIRAELERRGVAVPLVADIHFTPNAALEAALHVEKVRINPGNYADKKRFQVREYSDAEYAEEVARVQERFRPLVRRCRELGRAMRIGTNHGSLSDRIMNRHGDTPGGMVESALEFLDVCEDEGYRDVIFSMKASNPQVAIHAYRLLAERLALRAGGIEKESYPFHIGVTEAGDGEDGRVKSAIGIGALLEDGIGETIRVSLTEDPVKEIPVARALAARYDARRAEPATSGAGAALPADPIACERRPTRALRLVRVGPAFEIGAENPVRVELDLGPVPLQPGTSAAQLAGALSGLDLACEGLSVDVATAAELARAGELSEALAKHALQVPLAIRLAPGFWPQPTASFAGFVDRLVLRLADSAAPAELPDSTAGVPVEWCFEAEAPQVDTLLSAAMAGGRRPDLVSVTAARPTHAVRRLLASLAARGLEGTPLALRHRSDPLLDPEAALLHAATDLGGPLCDGFGDLVSLGGLGSPARSVSLAYRILQGARQRTSWTEFISCPSCGRTLFDLEETTARIKARTDHLPGLKIAVMGCIVNGPGEMADADFGYVGAGVGVVNLYVGHECVVRNVPAERAPDRLVELIQEHGRWVDPS